MIGTAATGEAAEATAERSDFRRLLAGVSEGAGACFTSPTVVARVFTGRRALVGSLLRSVRGVFCLVNLRSSVFVTGGNAIDRCTKAERGASGCCCLEGVLRGVTGILGCEANNLRCSGENACLIRNVDEPRVSLARSNEPR